MSATQWSRGCAVEQRREGWVGWLLVVCIDRARRGTARLSFSLSHSLSLFHFAPHSAWTSIYLHDVSVVRHFFLSGLSHFFPFFVPFPFNSLRANHPSLMSTSRSIGRCFCRSTNTNSELQTPRRADSDLLDTRNLYVFVFLFLTPSFSLIRGETFVGFH